MAAQPVRRRVTLIVVKAGMDTERRRIPLVKWQFIGMQSDMLVIAEAAYGRQAVDLWRKHRPDVTLLDLRMPMLDGVGVIDEIRK